MNDPSDIATDHKVSGVIGVTTGLGGTAATDESMRTAGTVKPPSDPIVKELRGKRAYRCSGIKCTSETSM